MTVNMDGVRLTDHMKRIGSTIYLEVLSQIDEIELVDREIERLVDCYAFAKAGEMMRLRKLIIDVINAKIAVRKWEDEIEV